MSTLDAIQKSSRRSRLPLHPNSSRKLRGARGESRSSCSAEFAGKNFFGRPADL
jgi:hypothetical protein